VPERVETHILADMCVQILPPGTRSATNGNWSAVVSGGKRVTGSHN
jgi:hypothetical protein